MENKNNNNKKTAIIVAIIVAILVIAAIVLFLGRDTGTIGNNVVTTTPTPSINVENTVTPTEKPTTIPTPTVSLDDIAGTVAPTVQPTATPKPVATSTPKPTVEPTETPVVTVNPTVTPTEVPTVKPTATPEPTATVAPTSTPTPIPTATSTPSPTVTSTPKPTAKPTTTPVGPTPTPRPTPIPGDDIGVEFDKTVTLESGSEMSVLTDYNNAGIYSDDTSKYGWFGDGQDNRDNTSKKEDEMLALEDVIGVTASNGTGFYLGNFAAEFYWDSVGSIPDLALYRDVDNKCYYLAINYDLTYNGMVTDNSKDRDVLRMLLSICSSNPIELEEEIYERAFGDKTYPKDTWYNIADVKLCRQSTKPVNGVLIYTLKQK